MDCFTSYLISKGSIFVEIWEHVFKGFTTAAEPINIIPILQKNFEHIFYKLIKVFKRLPFLRSVETGARVEYQTVICSPCWGAPFAELTSRCWHLSALPPTTAAKCSPREERGTHGWACLGLSYGPDMQLLCSSND